MAEYAALASGTYRDRKLLWNTIAKHRKWKAKGKASPSAAPLDRDGVWPALSEEVIAASYSRTLEDALAKYSEQQAKAIAEAQAQQEQVEPAAEAVDAAAPAVQPEAQPAEAQSERSASENVSNASTETETEANTEANTPQKRSEDSIDDVLRDDSEWSVSTSEEEEEPVEERPERQVKRVVEIARSLPVNIMKFPVAKRSESPVDDREKRIHESVDYLESELSKSVAVTRNMNSLI